MSRPPDTVLPLNEKGRFYHLNCGPGDVAPYVLTCGDMGRARKIARSFEQITVRRQNREFLTITGSYHDIPVSALGTGIGADNTAIAVIEAAQCVTPLTFIRLGTCGALQENIQVGDLIITEVAIRDEGTTHYYAPPEEPAPAHPEVIKALVQAARDLQVRFHVGITCTTGDFYAGQGRRAPGFPLIDPHKVERLSREGVLNLEMEMSAYLTLARVSTYKLRAGGACVVYANRITGQAAFASAKLRRQAEGRLIQVGLRAVEILNQRDLEKGAI